MGSHGTKRTIQSRRQPPTVARKPVSRAGTAIVVAPPAIKPWELSSEEVAILKNAVAKGATDEELKYCLSVARRYKLDPFQKQIWFVPRWDAQAEAAEGARGGRVWVPIVGIDGLRHIAARDHNDYGTFSEPTFGPMIEIKWQNKGKGPINVMKAPDWARVESWKKGAAHPTVGQVWWEEIYPEVDYAPLVRRMPRLMLAKCAMAQAIRANYPSTGGLLIPEETHNREFTQFTPEGRLIVPAESENKYLDAYHEREKKELEKLTPAQREVVERKMKSAEAEPRRAVAQDVNLGANHASAEMPTASIPCLFYTQKGDTYLIDGAQELKSANKDLLAPLWSQVAHAIVATPAQLGKLISQLEDRKVNFREIRSTQ